MPGVRFLGLIWYLHSVQANRYEMKNTSNLRRKKNSLREGAIVENLQALDAGETEIKSLLLQNRIALYFVPIKVSVYRACGLPWWLTW